MKTQKREMTEWQKSLVAEGKREYGEDLTKGLAEMYEVYRRDCICQEDALRFTDMELARRTVWMRKARKMAKGQAPIVTSAEQMAVLVEM